ncbi:MAG: glycosyltransferase family 4 protein [Candidatus Aenigmarchaeota archaeon]|nr:glycosyltransferase family 4 protein [Candidatus Aenigmarchaeota archaeon]
MTNFVSALTALNHSVTIISFAEEEYHYFSHHPLLTQKHFIIKQRFYKISLLSRLHKLFSFLKTKQPTQYDLVICDYYLPAFTYFLYCLILRKWKNIPMFYQFHGSVALEQHSQHVYKKNRLAQVNYAINYALENLCLSRADKIICFSNYSRSILEQTFNYGHKIVLIPPGREILFDTIYTKYTKQQCREELGLSLTRKIIFLASRIEPRKGIPECLKFLAEAKTRFPNTLVIVATNLIGFTDALASINGLPILYAQLPPREELAFLYRAADLTLMPSRQLETFGLATLESFSCGTPVVAYDIGANRELIPPEFLASISQPRSLVDVVVKVLNKDKESREQFSLSCIEKAGQYSWETYVQEVVSLI